MSGAEAALRDCARRVPKCFADSLDMRNVYSSMAVTSPLAGPALHVKEKWHSLTQCLASCWQVTHALRGLHQTHVEPCQLMRFSTPSVSSSHVTAPSIFCATCHATGDACVLAKHFAAGASFTFGPTDHTFPSPCLACNVPGCGMAAIFACHPSTASPAHALIMPRET